MSAVVPLGEIVKVAITEAFPTEAGNFTPWLAEQDNLDRLGTALRLELELEAVEQSVGSFRADIIAREVGEENSLVLIENQYGLTDHKHLGQVLTYLSGIDDASTIVWIAEEIREEHRAAVDWLNTNTIDRFSFFAVEIELLRIGGSAPAPRFNVVASPNDWSRTARATVRTLGSAPSNEREALLLDYWTQFLAFCADRNPPFRLPRPWPRTWLPIAVGRSGFATNPVILRNDRRIRAELYVQLKHGYPKLAFRALQQDQAAIEHEFGERLDWEALPGRQAVRIAIYRNDTDIGDRDQWPAQHEWLLERITRLQAVFRDRVAAIDFDELAAAEAAEEEPRE